MAGLPRKYAKMGFKKGWAAYRSKRKTPKKKTKKRSSAMARRKGVRGRARRTYRKFRRSRQNVIPVVDILHGAYTADGMTNKAVGKTAYQLLNILSGNTTSGSWDTAVNEATKGVNYAIQNPKDAIVGGTKNFATVWVVRSVLKWIGVPSSVKLGKKMRLQVR